MKSFSATFDALPIAMEEVRSMCHDLAIPRRVSARVALVFEELMTNTISYGVQGRQATQTERDISVELAIAEASVVLRYEDHGVAFNPFESEPKLADGPPTEVGKLGTHLVYALCSKIDYEYRNETNRLELTFPINGDCASMGDDPACG